MYALLRRYNVTLCWAESEKMEIPEVTTADFAYFRLRKPEYSPEERQAILKSVRAILARSQDVFTFFKHEETPDGALNAEELMKETR